MPMNRNYHWYEHTATHTHLLQQKRERGYKDDWHIQQSCGTGWQMGHSDGKTGRRRRRMKKKNKKKKRKNT
jgi:hypothetical protein